MQDIRLRTLIFISLIFLLSIVISKLFGFDVAVIFFIISLIIYLISHIFWLNELSKWLDKPRASEIPDGKGIWQDIFSKIYKNYRFDTKSKKDLTTAMEQFVQAADALLDGVVSLNDSNEIIWCNKRAQLMFGIHPKKDLNKPIHHIFRNSEFKKYLDGENYETPLQIDTENYINHIEVKIIPFGRYQKLLTARDISAMLKNELVRKEFVSNFTHELKTPLTVITGFIETLDQPKNSLSKDTKEIFTLMSDQANRMKDLINDLLLLSNIEASLNKNRSEKISVKRLFENIKVSTTKINKKKQKIKFEIDNELNIYGSKSEIQSAFTNLISNAVRYTPEKGNILITWHLINNLPIMEVTDSGVGIPKNKINRITERFYRVDEDRSRSSGGTGLGLSIVKNIMLQHQGQLEISSELNNGSTFKLIFPKDRIIKPS
ncbi:phosphate regulon sensor histidine kinase PhoR [Methylophilaceae bacterium]|nr:phosphate regulon sensor histidine kinase PhoR [Methylophilaceae bacterium]